jgi:hypothetical protein
MPALQTFALRSIPAGCLTCRTREEKCDEKKPNCKFQAIILFNYLTASRRKLFRPWNTLRLSNSQEILFLLITWHIFQQLAAILHLFPPNPRPILFYTSAATDYHIPFFLLCLLHLLLLPIPWFLAKPSQCCATTSTGIKHLSVKINVFVLPSTLI